MKLQYVLFFLLATFLVASAAVLKAQNPTGQDLVPVTGDDSEVTEVAVYDVSELENEEFGREILSMINPGTEVGENYRLCVKIICKTKKFKIKVCFCI